MPLNKIQLERRPVSLEKSRKTTLYQNMQ